MMVLIGGNPSILLMISGEYSYTYKPLDWLLRQMYNVYSKGWVRPSGM